MTTEEQLIRLSVRDLVEWVLRDGDIDNRRTGPAEETAMLLGANAHRRLQKAAGGDYTAEVPLDGLFSMAAPEEYASEPALTLELSGRADGVIRKHREDGTVETTVDEIKGIFSDVTALEAPVTVHLAQAECYAAMIARNEGLERVFVRMTYVQLVEEEDGVTPPDLDVVKRFTFEYTASEIERTVQHYADLYAKWAYFNAKHRRERNASSDGFPFPYEFRPGQKTIVRQAYDAIKEKRKLFIQAPTGIGKTLAVLYPAVRAVAQGLSEKIFYLTAKTVTGNVAEDGMKTMGEKGLAFSYAKITAKEKSCVLPRPACDPTRCERAKGHFSRVNEAIYDVITHETRFNSEILLQYAEKHQVCPYEFSLDVSLFSDVIICDYNYAFDPRVYFRRYFSGGGSDYIFLIDEAHNLADRAREMYSSVLVKEEVLAAKKLFADGRRVLNRLEKVNRVMLQLKRECEGRTVFTEGTFPTILIQELEALREAMQRYLDRRKDPEGNEERLDFYFKVYEFLDTFNEMDEGYLPYASFYPGGEFYVKLFCINPAGRLKERLDNARSSLFFSATLLPVQYYKELLTGNQEEQAVYVDSPFDPAKRKLLIARDVSSKYTRRGEEEYKKVASYLLEMVRQEKGNYLAFFPSYKFMEDTLSFLPESEEYELLVQKKNMPEEERQAFLKRFAVGEAHDRSLLGVSVLGGIFSEGIDLREDALIGVAVVGTGLPKVSEEQDLIRQYYESIGENGFDFAYRFPGFNKVLQAAGRLIRTPEDTGVILLLDERFLYRDTLSLFPREWAEYTVTDLENVGDEIRLFRRFL